MSSKLSSEMTSEEREQLRNFSSTCICDMCRKTRALFLEIEQLKKPPENSEEFTTSVGRVKCRDGEHVVFFRTFPEASTYVGKRLRVRIEVIS